MPEDTNTAQAAEVPTASTPSPEGVQVTPTEATTAPDTDVAETEGQDIEASDPKAIQKFQRREQRLRNERNSAREEAQQLRERLAATEGKMDEQAHAALTQERDTLKTELDNLKAERVTEQRRAELDGKVADVKAAMKLLEDSHMKPDGSIDLEKLYTDYPALKLTEGKPAATAPNGGGGTQQQGNVTTPDMQAAVASRDPAQINAAFEAQLAQNKR